MTRVEELRKKLENLQQNHLELVAKSKAEISKVQKELDSCLASERAETLMQNLSPEEKQQLLQRIEAESK